MGKKAHIDLNCFRNLEADRITEKLDVLCNRIAERFPISGLSKVCAELMQLSEETHQTCVWISKPNKWLRISVIAVILVIFIGLIETVITFRIGQNAFDLSEFITVLEAGMNSLVLVGAAIIFLITAEGRIKRSRTLKEINELRAIAHVIDMHQLTKDPEKIIYKNMGTPSSPHEEWSAFELTRYLDYCSEMLSLIGKIAALYAQNFGDEVVLGAVNEVENMTTALSRKIWQKIMIIHMVTES